VSLVLPTASIDLLAGFCPAREANSLQKRMKEKTLMELDWSEQSPHIRTLYHPWRESDGYEEPVIAAAEARLGTRLPSPLRIFYQAWGQHEGMTRTTHFLIGPVGLVRRPDALVICLENQGCCWWGIERHVLGELDPPVVIADPENWDVRDTHAPLIWMPSHAHLSDFLDRLTYEHAFAGGAIHGGYGVTKTSSHQEFPHGWLEQHWKRATVGSRLLWEANQEEVEMSAAVHF
jgi:hypothetical protein